MLVKNNFPNAPKIYGTIKLQGKETIGILEDVSNIGNLGDIYWNEVNKMIYDVFKRVNDDYSYLNNKEYMSNMIKKHCGESLKVSEKIGFQIKKLHNALILKDDPLYSKEMVDSKDYLKNYTDNLNSMVSKILNYTSKKSEGAFYNSPKITSIFLDIKDIIEKFRSEFDIQQITIQPVHQDLHFQQILYNKNNGDYMFYFIDFEGDPQLSQEERKERFPIEKDLASFLRSLSYIKFNTLINFIEKNIVDKNKFEVPAEFLFSLYFRKSSKISKKHKTLEIALNLLNLWENKLMGKIFDKSTKLHFALVNYFTIERTLHELNYELLFRPNNIIIPILGLKEIIDKN
ncbi:Glucosamine kinase [subsurface metagenome]